MRSLTITPSSLCLNLLSFHLISLLYLLWHGISHKNLWQTALIQITRVIITFKLCNWAVKRTVIEFIMSPVPTSPRSDTLFLSSCIFPSINFLLKKKSFHVFEHLCLCKSIMFNNAKQLLCHPRLTKCLLFQVNFTFSFPFTFLVTHNQQVDHHRVGICPYFPIPLSCRESAAGGNSYASTKSGPNCAIHSLAESKIVFLHI